MTSEPDPNAMMDAFVSIDFDQQVPELRSMLEHDPPAYLLVTNHKSDHDVFVLGMDRLRVLVDELDDEDELSRWTGGDLVRELNASPSLVINLDSHSDHRMRSSEQLEQVLRQGLVVTLENTVSAVLGATGVGDDWAPPPIFDELRLHATADRIEATAVSGGRQFALTRPEPEVTGLQVVVPGAVSFGENVWLRATLTRPGGDDPDIDFESAVGDQISIVVWPQEGVDLVGSGTATMTVAQGGGELAQVEFKVISPLRASVVVDAYSDQTFLGSALVEMRVTVTATPMAAERAKVIPLSRSRAPQSDLAVHIVETKDAAGERGLRFVAIEKGKPPIAFPFRRVSGDAKGYLQPLFEAINAALTKPGPGQPPPTTSPEEIVRTIGLTLSEDLFPPKLMSFLAEHQESIRSIVVHSEEGLLPWELCLLTNEDPDGRVEELGFLCELFELTRWRPLLPAREELKMTSIGVIAPADSGLKSRRAEVEMLEGLRSDGRTVSPVRATSKDVMSMLKTATYDVIHFIGHGELQDPANASSARMVLSGASYLSAGSIKGAARNFGRTGPLVFLNSCRIGSASPGLVGPVGFASAMLEAGSAAFVGAHWDVVDEKAHQFATTLYAHLVVGEPIGRAALAARLAIKDPEDPTWLAYTVFASPTAAIAAPD
ncbi:MAG TPA: CHAT domain-containing protein [Arachnia sp.]|nr:CHAT domain-containing protein [Arachnia sp.]HMT86277.1 CHAT domain-containing protein [Arachnia sp.]